MTMKAEGGCYCGKVRFEVAGDVIFKGQCHCRECQYYSGGQPNMVFGVPGNAFKLVSGAPGKFSRSDLEAPVTRSFCSSCGTPLWSESPYMPGAYLLKAGTLDNPADFGAAEMAIYMCDALPFHAKPEGIPVFDKAPGQ